MKETRMLFDIRCLLYLCDWASAYHPNREVSSARKEPR